MKKLNMLLMLLMVTCAISAQTSPAVTYTVKGVLLDSLSLEAEPYATIKVVRKDAPAQAVKMAVTDNKGKFEEKITGSGNYVLTISSIGKNTVVKEFKLSPSQRVMDLGTLYTADATNELQGVEIIAQKPLVKVDIDKIEYNIEDDPDSKTNSVLEMLRKVPLVTVDGEDKIQVNGSSNFKVHVNGKPNNMMSDNPTEVLKSMPANSIKHIEVITNPGPKYDAEGIGGILNIVTVGSGFEGYTATFSANASNMGAGGSLYATVKKNKLTLTGRYSYSYDDRPRTYSFSQRDIDAKEDSPASTVIQNSNSKGTGSFQHGSLEGSYEIDTLRLITMSFGMYGGSNDGKGDGYATMSDLDDNLIYHYESPSKNESSWYSIRGNIDYQRSFSLKGRLLTFSYNINTRPRSEDRYSYYKFKDEEMPAEWLSALRLQDKRSDGEQNTTEHTFQADYTTPIGKFHTIESGLKYILRNNNSDDNRYLAVSGTDDFSYDEKGSSHYKHVNDIFAAYAGYSLRYKILSGRVGLRYERTMQDVKYNERPQDNFKTNFNDLVPSASLGLKIGETKNLRMGYNMRIWRPGIYYLNPYVNDNDPTHIRQGNPLLESEKSHSFNLSYSSFTSKVNLNLSLYHSFNNNGIESITESRKPSDIPGLTVPSSENEVLYTTYENIGRSRNTGLNMYTNWNASPKTRIYMNASGGYSVLNNPKNNIKNTGWNGYAYGGIQHTIPLDIRLSLNFGGSTPYMTLQGRGSGYHFYSIGLNRSFIDKRLTLSAYASNFLKKNNDYSNTTHGVGFTLREENQYPARRFGISISYRIGELKASVKKAARTINNDDVKGGEGGSGAAGGGGE